MIGDTPKRFTTFTVGMMALSFGIGFLINYWSTRLANDRLLAQLKGQYDAILAAQQTARGSQSQELENRKMELQAQIKLLSKK